MLAALAAFPNRDRCLVIASLNTGYRISELAAITVGDVWDGTDVRPEVTVARRHLKGGSGVRRGQVRSRTVPLNPSAREAIRSYLAERLGRTGALDPAAPLFLSQRHGRSLRRWQANRIVHRVAAAAGVTTLARIGNHSLRKSFARKIFEACGRDINATRILMGHRNVTTTQHYLEVDADRLRAAVLAIG